MKKTLLATATAKLVAGVGAVAIATGTAGAVIATQPVADHDLPPQASAQAVEATSDSTTTTTTSTTVAPTTTTTTVAPTTTTTVPSSSDDEKERKDNFGAWVSEDARDGGVDGQEISAAARERNEERKAARAAEDDDDEKDDEDDDHGQRRGHDRDGD